MMYDQGGDRLLSIRQQGCYYLVGGFWPLLHFRSFEAVVGPKPDRFQTEVTSVLFVAIGAALLSATAEEGDVRPPARLLAVGSAAAVVGVEWRHFRRLPPVFWVEAALELAFATSALRTRSVRR